MYPFILYLFNFYDKIELENIRDMWFSWKNPAHWKSNINRFIKSSTDTDTFDK